MSTDLLIEQRDGWLRITLNRPHKLNSLTAAMLDALRAEFERAAADSAIRAVLLGGSGRAFCAGQDLADRAVVGDGDEKIDLGESLVKRYNPLIMAIRTIPKPVVCAVNGVAAGAGASLAFACDIIIAAQSAAFIQAFSRIGLTPDSGSTWFLPRLAGSGRAAALALLAEKIPAATAAEWGMIWRMVADDALSAAADELMQQLSSGSAGANAAIKSLLNAAAENTLQQQLELESEYQRRCGYSDDYREGVAAFMQKRPPKFNQ